ncbi:MAG: hypothetical protein HYX86_01070 [Chloroflexi bacterium]|nr:hypothetical protein [Chloroflexota bacterium]
MEDDLDLILRWTIKDLYPDVEPSPRVWLGIWSRLNASPRLVAKTSRAWTTRWAGAFYRHLEEGVWRPDWPVERYASPRAILEMKHLGPLYQQKQTILVGWSLYRALPNHSF